MSGLVKVFGGPVNARAGVEISTDNTTTTALTSAGTFTGTWERAPDDGVAVSCKTDNTGTLYFDFSNDGTNVDTFPTGGFKIASGVHEYHTAKVNGRYFRVRMANDAGDQSYLRLYTYYTTHTQPNAPLNQPLGLDADATLVRPTFPWLDVRRGLVSGMSVVKKFGRSTNVGTTYAPVALGNIYRTPQSGSATTLRIASGGAAQNTAAGTGAREITLEGLDQNWNTAVETLATAGASASSSTTTTFTRLYRAYVSASGTYATSSAGSHVAGTNIVIQNTAGTQTWGSIDAANFAKSQSEIGFYSVPTGYTAYVFLDDITIDTNKTTDVIWFWRTGADETAAPYSAMRAQSVIIGLTSNADISGRQIPYGPYVGPCDVGFMAKVDTGTASVAVEFEIFLVNE